MKSSMMKWFASVGVALTTAALVVGCGSSSDSTATATTAKVATANTTTAINPSTGSNLVAAVASTNGTANVFNFGTGLTASNVTNAAGSPLPVVLTNSASSITFTAGTTPTFKLTQGAAKADGVFGFGSCIWTVSATTGGFLPVDSPLNTVGSKITINTCSVTAGTNGGTANGTAQILPVTLTVGSSTSTVNMPVTIGTDGTVTINGTSAGVAATGTPTGA